MLGGPVVLHLTNFNTGCVVCRTNLSFISEYLHQAVKRLTLLHVLAVHLVVSF